MKNRSNSIQALIQNWSDVEKSIGVANNATGTAREEQERYAQSMQGRIDSLKASWQALSNTFLSSDFLSGLISTASTLLNLLDNIIGKIGIFPSLITGIGAALSASQNFGRDKMFSLLTKYAESNNSSVWIQTV